MECGRHLVSIILLGSAILSIDAVAAAPTAFAAAARAEAVAAGILKGVVLVALEADDAFVAGILKGIVLGAVDAEDAFVAAPAALFLRHQQYTPLLRQQYSPAQQRFSQPQRQQRRQLPDQQQPQLQYLGLMTQWLSEPWQAQLQTEFRHRLAHQQREHTTYSMVSH